MNEWTCFDMTSPKYHEVTLVDGPLMSPLMSSQSPLTRH